MVMVLAAHVADTPAGNPLAPATALFAMPVAPVVLWVMFVKTVFLQSVGEDDAAASVLQQVCRQE